MHGAARSENSLECNRTEKGSLGRVDPLRVAPGKADPRRAGTREGGIQGRSNQGGQNPKNEEPSEVRIKETESRESGNMRAEQPGGSIRFLDGAGVQEDTEMDYWGLRNSLEELFNTLDRQRGNSMVGSLRKVRAHCPWRMPAGLQ